MEKNSIKVESAGSKKYENIHIRVIPERARQIDLEAKRQFRTRAGFINMVINKYFENLAAGREE